MKNYIIGTLGVIILVLVSVIYKSETSSIYRFPSLKEANSADVEVPLFLYVFLTKRNCLDCLEFIEVLNDLPPHFVVSGIVPEEELKDEKELRRITGAAFPLMVVKSKKYTPRYTPSVVGVSPAGDILFVLPGVPGEKSYLKNFLDSLYIKLYPIFLEEKFSGRGILNKRQMNDDVIHLQRKFTRHDEMSEITNSMIGWLKCFKTKVLTNTYYRVII